MHGTSSQRENGTSLVAKIDHLPHGDPCIQCGYPLLAHRVKHVPNGNPCTCGLPPENHRPAGSRGKVSKKKPWKDRTYIMGVDGEGQGRSPHVYSLLGASNEDGSFQRTCENPNGLGTAECLDFLLSLPAHARLFGYSLGYDWTKILKDLDDETLYKLFRPDTRRSKRGPANVAWGPYQLNLVATKFSVRDVRNNKRRVVWDIWKFFRGKFVSALRDWKVETNLAAMEAMKDKRADFDKESKENVRAYCLEETRCMAVLTRKLIEAHNDAKLPLKSFFGAGSTASVLLDLMAIKDKRGECPAEMAPAVASAFFGGRFEHTVVGAVPGPIYSYDISSAYPYQLCFLPCLEHGTWERTRDRKRMERARAACVRYSLSQMPSDAPWAPFPFRLPDGTIIFPGLSGGGWLWRDEFLWGEKLAPLETHFHEAWVLEQDCDCPSPFHLIPEAYRTRVRLGKEAAGTCWKLGMNSVYGKLAQSSGSAPYQSWIWAGIVTSYCRAQILEFLMLHQDPHNMLMVATDGVYTKEKLQTPRPKDTGTWETKKPLGGWEEKVLENGVFAARPGIYFPMSPTSADIDGFRARGISKAVLVRDWRNILNSWEQGHSEVDIPSVSRFVGAKSGTLRSSKGYLRTDSCGEWVERKIRLSFSPLPKRSACSGQTLLRRDLTAQDTSLPYKRSLISEETEELRLAESEAEEQPDGGDYTDYT